MPFKHIKATLDSRLITILSQPPAQRFVSIGVISLIILGIGVIDYVSGIWISLQLFYLTPIALAVAWLGLTPAFFTSISCILVRVGTDYLLDAPYTHEPTVVWNSLVFLATYMIVAWGIHLLINFQRELEQRVEARTTALAHEISAREQLQHELIELSERERRTIGNDLHDGLGQHLTAMAYAAQILCQRLATQQHPSTKSAEEIVRLAEEGINQSRQLARGLLLTVIEPDTLNNELGELAASVQRQNGMRCYYDPPIDSLVIDTATATHLFRIAQEAVRNAVRHAHPTAITIALTNDQEVVLLTISDNGTGITQDSRNKIGVGLRVMPQRAQLLGGELTIDSSPGHGTQIHCRVPMKRPRQVIS